MMKMGASGIQIATRFVCTHECDADEKFKQAYIDAREDDITIIKSPVGMPGRAIKNAFIKKTRISKVKFKCSYQCLKTCNPAASPYCIAEALINAAEGKNDEAVIFVGSEAHRIQKIVSVKEVIGEIVNEAEKNL